MKLLERSTTDLLILMVAGTICFSVLATGTTAGVLLVFRPDTDAAKIIVLLGDVLNTLIGLLAGFLAGRTDQSHQAHVRRREEEEKV